MTPESPQIRGSTGPASRAGGSAGVADPAVDPGEPRGRCFWDGHAERVRLFTADLRARGVRMHWAAPPLYRLLWLLRIRVPPPLFQSFRGIAWTMGTFFGLMWGLSMGFMTFFLWPVFPSTGLHSPGPAVSLWIASLVAGTLFGLGMAFTTRRKARSLGLPPWDQYPAETIARVFT